jgi:hypothetical protein
LAPAATSVDPELLAPLAGLGDILSAEVHGNRLRLVLASEPQAAAVGELDDRFHGVAVLPGNVLHLIAASPSAWE